ncbi:MAG: histidine phosphatase family protein [Oscillospiraceae bacterium]|nr:histidine phosphatase family protein [Oscillospiraceae bacterium]
MTRVYFVRHAQSDWRSGSDRERGLTAEALEDRKVVLDFLRDKQVDVFYCSPYRRSLDTIQETAEFYDKPILTDERLRERETVPGGNNRELFRKRWADFDWKEPGGESLRSVQERNIAALTDILGRDRDKTIVIGTHGTALSTILNYYDPSYNCDSFLRIIDWMPFIVELDFDGTRFLSMTEHVHVEKLFKP